MSPIFRHGRLRLYLLKLLDEAPRHGYEVIRLLQDRFMGVYSPSPGTIYPRLARLEDDGLVTHDEVDGRKVYRITEKGREEIRARLDDLAELEEELTESVRDIAREVSEDVRDTVRSLREEITWAARDIRRGPRQAPADVADRDGGASGGRDDDADGQAPGGGQDGRGKGSDDARRIRDEARQAREEMRDTFRSQRRNRQDSDRQDSDRQDSDRQDSDRQDSDRQDSDRQDSDRQDSDRQDWGRPGWGRPDWGRQDWGRWTDRAGFSGKGMRGEGPGRPGGGWQGGGWQDWAGMSAGLERLASDFARELRSAAGHAGDVGEGAMGDLRDILADTLARIRDEVFTDGPGGKDRAQDDGGRDDRQHGASQDRADGEPDDGRQSGGQPPTA